jgi:hypothetical protein
MLIVETRKKKKRKCILNYANFRLKNNIAPWKDSTILQGRQRSIVKFF